MKYNDELQTFITISLIAIFSTCYCYFIPSQIPHGLRRLLSLLPIITIFAALPLPLSAAHLAFPAFFFLVWLGNFKLLLFAFNRGPLSSTPRLPIRTFITIALLPVTHKQTNIIILNTHPFSLVPKPIVLTVKSLILVLIIHVYQYKESLHHSLVIVLYFAHMYLGFELGFAAIAFCVNIILGFDFEIDPQFNEPYLATSVQDFWGRRWNLVSSGILRATVYNPVRAMWTPVLGKLQGKMVAVFLTFVVSGFMHELMYFYLMRVAPTWEVSWFFVWHGVWTAAEVAVKEVYGGFRLPGVVSGPLTMAFLFVTGVWLFYVQPIRNGLDVKFIDESSLVLKSIWSE